MYLTDVRIRETLGKPRGVVVVGKKFISGREERKLGNEKASRQNFTSPPGPLTYSLRHAVRASSRATFGTRG